VKLFVIYEVILYDPESILLSKSILLSETHRLTHVLIDDHVSRIIDMGISN
jgi:hypothetical protein